MKKLTCHCGEVEAEINVSDLEKARRCNCSICKRKGAIMSMVKNEDFRINPTYNNSLKFSEWILNGKKNTPNFHSAARVHYILNLLVKSSRLKRNIFCYKI